MNEARQKAEELVGYFIELNHTKLSDYSRIEFPTAKQCALKVVDEIIDAIDWHEFEYPNKEFYYWQEVKTEIQNL
jgi:hypothetical protein